MDKNSCYNYFFFKFVIVFFSLVRIRRGDDFFKNELEKNRNSNLYFCYVLKCINCCYLLNFCGVLYEVVLVSYLEI